MKVAVIGVGAMGCLFAARLHSRAELVMLGNWPQQVAAIREHGLELVAPDGRRTHHTLAITSHPAAAAPADLALILVKSRQTERAAAWAKEVLAPDGLALTLQNGLGNLEMLTAVLGQSQTALGVTSAGANVARPGQVRHAGWGVTHLAAAPETAARLEQTAALFRAARFETHLTGSVAGLVWGKLAVNSGINPLTALLDVPNGFLAENETARRLMELAAAETAAVAAAQGIQLPFPDAGQRALAVAQATAANSSSMRQDARRGADTEIEAICGAVVRVGRELAVPTPINQALLTWVKKLEAGQWRPPADAKAALPQLIANFGFARF